MTEFVTENDDQNADDLRLQFIKYNLNILKI